MTKCTRCVDGTTTIQVVTIAFPGIRTEETVTISCIYCDGTTEDKGKVFVEDMVTWCDCGPAQTFGSYPQFRECDCGVETAHVHCGTCGKISQVG